MVYIVGSYAAFAACLINFHDEAALRPGEVELTLVAGLAIKLCYHVGLKSVWRDLIYELVLSDHWAMTLDFHRSDVSVWLKL